MKKVLLFVIVSSLFSCFQFIEIIPEESVWFSDIDIVPINPTLYYVKGVVYDTSNENFFIENIGIYNETFNDLVLSFKTDYFDDYSVFFSWEFSGFIGVPENSNSEVSLFFKNSDAVKDVTFKIPDLELGLIYNQEVVEEYWKGQSSLTIRLGEDIRFFKSVIFDDEIQIDFLESDKDILFWTLPEKAKEIGMNGFYIFYYHSVNITKDINNLNITANVFENTPEVIHVGN